MIDEPGPWGTGPFVLKEGFSVLDKRSPTLTLEPNPTYWNKARMPKATFVFDNVISKAEALEEVAKGGKVDIVTELTPSEAVALKSSTKARLVESKAKTVLVGVINRNAPASRWNDIKVRQALNKAVDRAMVVKQGAKGYGTVIPAMIVPGHYGYDADLQPYAYEPAAAGKALKAAGISGITVVAGEGYKGVVEAMAASLEKAGVKVTADYSGTPKGDGWDVWLVEHFDWSPEYPYGVVFREFFAKDGGFRKMPEDPKFEAMGKAILAEKSKANLEKKTAELNRYVHEQANVVFLYAPSKLYAVSNRVDFVPFKTWMLELAETTVKPGADKQAMAK
ncbi:MAG: ABC transporter substrate-binding protein [Methylibium sp.]|nr:ABC transporter substrate-binding protein [Methylibium sp.]